jgi:hypothetical protein
MTGPDLAALPESMVDEPPDALRLGLVGAGRRRIPVRRSAAVTASLSQLTTAVSWLRTGIAVTPERSRVFVDLLTGYARQAPALLDG